MPERPVRLSINGTPIAATVEPRMTLADFLRERCGLTGTHLGCEHGSCGACTVLVDGDAVRSCLLFAVQADGPEVTTVEGIASPDGEWSPVQAALRECHGLQCGFCTPGFVMSLTALLRDNPDPTEDEIREALSGNFCRCTGTRALSPPRIESPKCRRCSGNALPSTPFQKRVTAVTCVVPCVI